MEDHDYIQHPKHQLPELVQRGLDEMRASRMDALARRHQMAIESRPTTTEREQFNALIGESVRLDESAAKALDRRYHDRVRHIEEFADFTAPLPPIDNAPEPHSADFWWARTQWFAGGGLHALGLTDGVHFFGRVNYDSDPLVFFSAGAWATFELQPERRPPSASGRYNSLPHVELFGNVTGWTGLQHCPWTCDDKWCKCFLFLRQSAIQFIDDAGTWSGCGEAISWRTLIDEDGNGRTVVAPLPGFLPMPPLQFSLLRPDRPIIIDLEVRFDVQLEGSSFIGFSPGDDPGGSVLLRYFQWPCVAA